MNWPDYGQLSQWLMLFGQTVAVGMIAVIGYAVLGDILDRQRAVVKSALIGALFGCAAVALMNFPVRIADGIILDTRNVLVLIGCFSADPPGALFAIALPVLFRVDLGGAGVTMGIASIVATGLIGLSVRRYYRDRVRDFGLGQFALIGLAPALVTIAAVRGALAINGLSSIAGTFDVAVLVIYPCVTALIGSAMSMTYYRAWRRTRRRLVDILETASDLVWETDGANHLTFVSDRFRGILGFEAAELLGSNIDALGGRWLDEATRAAHVSALAAREPFDELTYLATAKDGSRKTLSISARPHLDPKGRFLGYRGTAVDITDRERWQALIATVSGQVGDRVGDEFLRTLTRSVAEALGADWAFLSRYDAERRAVRSLVRFAEGKVTANNEVLVGDLPAGELVKGRSLVIPSGLAQRFPRYAEITGCPAEAYAGTPLVGAKGEVLGILAVSFRKPIRADGVEPVLRMFAGRAAAEMERSMIEEELRRSRDRLLRAQRMGKIGNAEVNLVTGEVSWSDEQYRIFGLDPAKGGASYDLFLALVHPDDREAARAARALNAGGVQTPPLVYRTVWPNSEVRWMHREVEIEFDAAGLPVKFFTTQQDITERRTMEEALRRSLAASVRAHRIGRIGSAEIDLRTDTSVWSDEMCRLYGREPGTSPPSFEAYLQLVHPDDRDAIRATRHLEGIGQGTRPIEFRIVRPDGEVRWLHQEIEIEFDESGAATGLFTTQQDITDRRKMEEELRFSAQHLANAQRVGKIASIEVDMATRRVTWSSEAFRVFGIDPAVGQPRRHEFVNLIHPDDRPHMLEVWRREVDGQETEPFEYRLLRSDGETRWIYRQTDFLRDAAGKPTRLIMTHQDITEREKMRRLMAEVLAALDVARDGVILADEDRRIGYANDAAIDLLGLPRDMEKVKGKRLPEFQQTETFRVLAEEIVSALGAQGQWQGTGGWVRPSDGRPMHFDIRVHRLPNGGIVIVLADAGARVQVEAEERRRQEWQAQASKLEALGNLAGGIAHDFNNLLGAILGFGQFLVEDLEPGTEPRHFAERIVAVSQRGRSLVQQILSFSRRSPVESAEVRLASAIDEAYELLHATLPATTETIVDIRAPDAAVLGDRGQIVQVLVNLCVNGSDALGGVPGKIRIAVAETVPGRPELARLPAAGGRSSPAGVEVWSAVDGEGWMATGTMPPGPCVSISVSDSGTGIPEAVRRQIFEPFFTTKDRGRGTGLGLAVVQRIVLEHGGAILVRTRPGAGTSFELILPLMAAKASHAAASHDGREGADRDLSRTSILVVDDDESFCAMVDTALRRSGYRVQSTNDPRVAMAWVKRHAEAWDILVTDQTMPFVKGEELVRYFKAHSPGTRSIICTGYSSDMTEQRARAAGAEALLLKPFEFERLASLVNRIVQEAGAGKA